MKISEIKVKDVMKTRVIDISPDSTLSEARSKMLSHNVHQLPVMEKSSLLGMITYKNIIETGAPVNVKVKNICSRTQALSPEDKISLAARRMLELDVKALPVMENKKVIGIISSSDIIPLIGKASINEGIESIMTSPITIKRTESLGKARTLMRDHDISVLPVTENDGSIFGAISFFDVLKVIVPKESQDRGSKDGTLTASDFDASTIAGKAITIERQKSISDAAKVMGSNGASSLIIDDNGKPLGVVAQKDMLELIASSETNGVYVQITNRAKLDSFTKEKLDDIIEDSIQKTGDIFDTKAFFLHIKTHEKGGRTKYSVRARLKTAQRTFSSKAWGWQLLKVTTEVLRQLERLTIQRKEKSLTRRKRNGHFRDNRGV